MIKKNITLKGNGNYVTESNNIYTVTGIYDNTIKSLNINWIKIPFSFYNIHSSNNTLVTSAGTVTLTPGQYDIDDITTEIATQLQVFDATFTCTYSLITYKITIARTTNFDITLSSSTLNTVLGFGTTDLTGAATYTSTNCYDINTSSIVYMHSRNLSTLNNSISHDDRAYALFSIPMLAKSGEIMYYLPQQPQYFDINLKYNLVKDQWWFTREDGTTIDFNGVEWMINFDMNY